MRNNNNDNNNNNAKTARKNVEILAREIPYRDPAVLPAVPNSYNIKEQ